MTSDVHSLSGAYALDALSDEEAAEFRRHLADCAVCREEVAGLRAAAASMGASQRVAPPPELRARVLSAALRVPQQPPRATVTPIARRRSWTTRALVAAAAAVLVAAVGVGVSRIGGDDPGPSLASGVTQVFEAPDRRLAEVRTDQGTVRVAASPSRDEMAVDARGLEAPDEGRVYQLWSIDSDGAVSVGLLDDDTVGASMPMPAEGTQVAITLEPAGGSEQPTGEPLVQVDPTTL
jgi:anti-sigma-K factor RskA